MISYHSDIHIDTKQNDELVSKRCRNNLEELKIIKFDG